ncbi:hypothetical protein EJB05_48341 [Eragrostis curvula]|uniref:Phytocyanin domain-containing protein n=1 Tax=Eragrostis curvula TaxID=38414 RepID=A0A5J9T1V3_9POAL|nr:hypothetical protein EJB05_48341 [Eragrostis curvula]
MAIRVGGRADGLPLLLLLIAVVVLSSGSPVAATAEAPAPSSSPGLVFHVGGPRGWRVPDATTNYGWWAMNNRFHVGDELYFKYGNDSVLVVDREAFDACNTTDPVAVFTDGATAFRFDRRGFFCFISGEPGHCEDGQRLVVRVMVHSAAPGPAVDGPATSELPGHGGGSARGGHRHCPPGESSGAAATTTVAGVAVAVAAVVVTSLVLMFAAPACADSRP